LPGIAAVDLARFDREKQAHLEGNAGYRCLARAGLQEVIVSIVDLSWWGLQAFKSYDEAGAVRRVQCLKYLVLANMLMESSVDPFDAQEAKPYKNDPQVKTHPAF
jgi:hypothetical protein